MKYIQELEDRPFYILVEKAGFFDKELVLADDMMRVLIRIQGDALKAQEFMRTVYMGGDRPKVEIPAWLERERDGQKLDKQASAQGSSKTLHLPPKQTESPTSTK